MIGSTSAQKVQSEYKTMLIMSLVTMKAHLCTAKVTSLIMHEVPRRNKKNPQSSWHHGKSRNDNQKNTQGGTNLCQ